MIPALALLVSGALAGGSPAVFFEAGLTRAVNDPFQREGGIRLGAELAPADRFRLGAFATLTPNLGEAGYTDLGHEMINELHIAPDLSARTFNAAATMRIVLVEGERDRMSTNVSLVGGLGYLRTSDDLDALGVDSSDSRALSTANEFHAHSLIGLAGEVWPGEHFGFRWSFESMSYIETVFGTTLEMKRVVRTSGVALCRF